MSEMLTTTELAERYPVANVNSRESWTRLLKRWRDRGNLSSSHWDVRRMDGAHCRPPLEYDVREVLSLVWASDNIFAVSVKRRHKEAIKAVLCGGKDTVGV